MAGFEYSGASAPWISGAAGMLKPGKTGAPSAVATCGHADAEADCDIGLGQRPEVGGPWLLVSAMACACNDGADVAAGGGAVSGKRADSDTGTICGHGASVDGGLADDGKDGDSSAGAAGGHGKASKGADADTDAGHDGAGADGGRAAEMTGGTLAGAFEDIDNVPTLPVCDCSSVAFTAREAGSGRRAGDSPGAIRGQWDAGCSDAVFGQGVRDKFIME